VLTASEITEVGRVHLNQQADRALRHRIRMPWQLPRGRHFRSSQVDHFWAADGPSRIDGKQNEGNAGPDTRQVRPDPRRVGSVLTPYHSQGSRPRPDLLGRDDSPGGSGPCDLERRISQVVGAATDLHSRDVGSVRG